jgi:peptidoglycan/xylan/chitin deacetylase (PgdA/CDA1 family)
MSTSFVELKSVLNASLDTPIIPARSGWAGFPIPAKTLGGLPTGRGEFARVPFRLPAPAGQKSLGMLVIEAEDTAPRSIAIGDTLTALYVLHTIDRGAVGRKPVAYTMHYADGSSSEHEIVVGRDLADWLFPQEKRNCRIGWTGYLPDNEFQKCVYVAELVNPEPRKVVVSVSLSRREPYGRYVLLAMTRSAARPFFAAAARGGKAGLTPYVDLADDILELKDGVLTLEAAARGADGQPLSGARLTAEIAGKRYDFRTSGGAKVLTVARQKSWRKYANRVRLVARRGGKVVAAHEAVLYASGTPRRLTAPHGHRPPQFIVVAFDDCKGLPGVLGMLQIIENLRAEGASAPLTMYTSPCEPRSADMAKVTLLYQRMFDLGCEFANHTLNHNPGGVNWFALPREGQVQEIDGCRQWLRSHIHGLWHVYSQKSGGGGAAGFRDPKFSRDLLKSQKFEYNANNVTAHYQTDVPHPDVQFWPYKLADEWSIDIGLIDGNAPPVHTPITKGFYTDYSGKFDYPVADGVAMMVANLDYRYRLPNRPPLIINAMHEWGIGTYFPSHVHERAILEGFLREVLVKQRKKYPNTHVVTLHQLIEYTRRDDLRAILAEGNGQGKKEHE